ncbi:MAG: hypothetical protein GY829_04450 [Gammaproteobacteria bacterium]|nr:hypothetical protein [Gammaproteobacteria bacterium]
MTSRVSYSMVQMSGLIQRFDQYGIKGRGALANAMNRGNTYSRNLGVNEIKKSVNLDEAFIKTKLKALKRASPQKLRTEIGTPSRGVLLTRYPHSKVDKGYNVRVKRGGGGTDITGAFRMKLRGTGGKYGLGIRSGVAARMRGSFKSQTFARIQAMNRRTRGRGVWMMYSMSVGQMFKLLRDDVSQPTIGFIRQEFLKNLENL